MFFKYFNFKTMDIKKVNVLQKARYGKPCGKMNVSIV